MTSRVRKVVVVVVVVVTYAYKHTSEGSVPRQWRSHRTGARRVGEPTSLEPDTHNAGTGLQIVGDPTLVLVLLRFNDSTHWGRKYEI